MLLNAFFLLSLWAWGFLKISLYVAYKLVKLLTSLKIRYSYWEEKAFFLSGHLVREIHSLFEVCSPGRRTSLEGMRHCSFFLYYSLLLLFFYVGYHQEASLFHWEVWELHASQGETGPQMLKRFAWVLERQGGRTSSLWELAGNQSVPRLRM